MPRYRQLDTAHAFKPLDFGNGRLAGSVMPDGRLLSLSTYHPTQGYVTLSSFAPFDDSKRYDQRAVRSYRAALADPQERVFGFQQEWDEVSVALIEDVVPYARLRDGALHADVTTWAVRSGDSALPAALQRWQLENTNDAPLTWSFQWTGDLTLTRASMTQLTERNVISAPTSSLEVEIQDNILILRAVHLDVVLAIAGIPFREHTILSNKNRTRISLAGELVLPAQERRRIPLIFAFAHSVEVAHRRARRLLRTNLSPELHAELKTWRVRWEQIDAGVSEDLHLPVHRALGYSLTCCALPVEDSVCLLTDHQILPLSWTRDAYYVIQALLTQSEPHVQDLVRRHLLWLFEHAQRPDGYWGRAYLPHGRLKDPVFQLDQQCYPLLELIEYVERTGDDVTLLRVSDQVQTVLEAILRHRSTEADGLFASEETPADDELALPYHYSSHVLLWHTLSQLAILDDRYDLTDVAVTALADVVRRDTLQYMVTSLGDRELFAYAVDGAGSRSLYHDANDLPTVLAPAWGFCSADNPVWRATMAFAFSRENEGGFYAGEYGGLGSVHTPGAWPLGDVQELIYTRIIGDEVRERRVRQRIAVTMCWDGGLPEARSEETGAVRSRHWFAWPGAALAAALLSPDWRPGT